MKKILKTVLLFVLTLSLSSCTNGNKKTDIKGNKVTLKPVEVVFWHTYSEKHNETLEKIVKEFNSSQNEVKVIAQQQPLTDFDAKVMQAVRNGTGPDFMFAYPRDAMNYINEDLIVDLGKHINDPQIGIKDYDKSMPKVFFEEISQWDDTIYMMPIVKTGEIFFYNKTLYDKLKLEVPTTWEQLEHNCRKIKEETGKPGFGVDFLAELGQDLIIQSGSGYIDVKEKKATFNNPEVAETIQWYGNLVKEGVFRLAGSDVYLSGPFGSGNLASYVATSAGYNFIMDAVDNKFEVGFAPLPQGGKVKYASSLGASAMVFKSDEATQRGAYLFLKYFTSLEKSADWAIAYGGISPYNKSLETPQFKAFKESNPMIETLIKARQNIGYLPAISGSEDARNQIEKMMEAVSIGDKSAIDAIEEAVKNINAELGAK